MPLYGLEVTAILHDSAHVLRRRVREAVEMKAPAAGIEDMVRAHLLDTAASVLRLPLPCGAQYGLAPVSRLCERERGHRGEHDGNL